MKDMQEMQQFARPGLDYATLVEDIARWARAFDDDLGSPLVIYSVDFKSRGVGGCGVHPARDGRPPGP
jgi:hypothetical protein